MLRCITAWRCARTHICIKTHTCKYFAKSSVVFWLYALNSIWLISGISFFISSITLWDDAARWLKLLNLLLFISVSSVGGSGIFHNLLLLLVPITNSWFVSLISKSSFLLMNMSLSQKTPTHPLSHVLVILNKFIFMFVNMCAVATSSGKDGSGSFPFAVLDIVWLEQDLMSSLLWDLVGTSWISLVFLVTHVLVAPVSGWIYFSGWRSSSGLSSLNSASYLLEVESDDILFEVGLVLMRFKATNVLTYLSLVCRLDCVLKFSFILLLLYLLTSIFLLPSADQHLQLE